MSKAIISLKDEQAQYIVKEAKKKSIDAEISFSEVVIKLLEQWVSGKVTVTKGGKKK